MSNTNDNKPSAAAAPSAAATSFLSVPAGDASRLSQARRHGQRSRSESSRTRQESLGGLQLQLSVSGNIPGYHLYWENDENGAIERLLQEGFDFVTQDELNQKQPLVVPDLDISSCVSKYVKGQKVDGSPLRAYLMKCTDDTWTDRERARYEKADAWDSQIRAGTIQHSDGRYAPKHHAIKLDTNQTSE